MTSILRWGGQCDAWQNGANKNGNGNYSRASDTTGSAICCLRNTRRGLGKFILVAINKGATTKRYLGLCILESCGFGYGGCYITPMPTVPCAMRKGPEWSPIAYFQKAATLRHTDSAQRWRDAVACGADYGDTSLRSAMTHSKDGAIDDYLADKFDNCMKNRGYRYLFLEYDKNGERIDCGTQDPSEDKGLCNL